jgi:hypothetical protein
MANNLRKLLIQAESVNSSASTVIEGDRSTVWNGSVLGDPLSQEQYRNITGWIPPPISEEPREGKFLCIDWFLLPLI